MTADTAQQLRTHLEVLSSVSPLRVVLDVSGVESIDLAGLAAVVPAVQRARNDGGWIRLICASASPVQQLFGAAEVGSEGIDGTLVGGFRFDDYARSA